MPSATCLENIKKEKPPWNVPCTDKGCAKVWQALESHCQGLPAGTPVLAYDDYLGQPCYCCCSCFAWDTPIEASPGSYRLVQDLKEGDLIMTAGTNLQWRQKPIQIVAGFYTEKPINFAFTLRFEYVSGSETYRDIVVMEDHLFLMMDGKLKAVQNIVPNDVLKRADGNAARVLWVQNVQYAGGVRSMQMGPFDGVNLTDHLVNSDGIVSADYAVQSYYSTGQLAAEHLSVASDAEELRVGTAAYMKAHPPSDDQKAFLADPSSWPAGVHAQQMDLVNIPPGAYRYFTDQQAFELFTKAEFNSPGNITAMKMTEYLFTTTNAFYPKLIFLIDWNNALPNLYAFSNLFESIIVVTGGFARLKVLGRSGLSLALSTMVSYFEGRRCVGEADYYGAGTVLRKLWDGSLYGETFMAGLAEIKAIFDLITDNTGPDLNNRCLDPGLNCRLKTYQSAFALLPIPSCASAHQDTFGLKAAKATIDLKEVKVAFTQAVNPPTAETVENYTLTPETVITAARLSEDFANEVALSVTDLAPNTEFQLKVENITSQDDEPLAEDKKTATFKTGSPFAVENATPTDDLLGVRVRFTEDVDPATASDASNYKLNPSDDITGAEVDCDNPREVLLTCAPLTPLTDYILTVSNVTSASGLPLADAGNAAFFRTPATE